jgi:hypothetical protein
MARPKKEVSYTLVKLTKTKLIDPYRPERGAVSVGHHMVVDESNANFLESTGMCDIVQEGVLPPWDPGFVPPEDVYDYPKAPEPTAPEPAKVETPAKEKTNAPKEGKV